MQKYYRGDFGPRGSKMPRGTREELLWRKVDKREPDECWPWTGARGPKGYGKAKIKGKWEAPHRLAYELANGPIPDDLQIDHLCRNPPCCNPAHMEVVTLQENVRRKNEQATHCKRGHPLSGDNLYTVRNDSRRHCRTCVQARNRDYMRKKRAAMKEQL